MATIAEALQNADYNLTKNGAVGAVLAKIQLHNAAVLIEKGYGLETEIETLLAEHRIVENVPEFDKG